MELTEIRNFMVIAELGSFSRASLRLGVPQATLSRQLARLEGDLGTALFYRHGRGARLTDVGRRFIDEIAPVVRSLDRVRSEILAEARSDGGTVRLGIPPSVGRSVAASIVASFGRRCPEARLQLVEAFSGTLAEWLESGAVDAAILYDTKRAPHISVSPVLREELFLIRTGSAGDAPVSAARIDQDRLILSTPGQGLRRAVDAAFDAAKLTLRCALEIDSIAATKELVERESYCAILPYGAVHREAGEGRLSAAPVAGMPELSAQLVVGTALSQPVTRATRRLLQIIDDEIAACLARGILRGRPGPARRVVPFVQPRRAGSA